MTTSPIHNILLTIIGGDRPRVVLDRVKSF